MDAKLAKQLADAKAELEAALAESAAIASGKLPRATRAKRAKAPARPSRRAARPLHRPENGMHRSIEGYGGAAPVGTRLRTNDAKVVTKEYDATKRPVRVKPERKVSVMIFDAGAVWRPEASAVMTERESDELMAILPFGWTLTSRPSR